MKIQELYDIFQHFVDNDFAHLRTKVDWLFYSIILMLLGIIGNLVLLIVKIL